MENKEKKCSFKEHEEINANYYCGECRVYMCKKCENFHSKLLHNHQIFNLEKENQEIFTGLCNEEDHQKKLEFFCKTHNQLCCVVCISKIKLNKYGIHKDCDVCLLEDIKDEKKRKIKDNIKYLEDLSNNLEESINLLNEFYEKIKKEKEEIKLKIQNIFTKIRNELNNREDNLLLEVDKEFDTIYFNENIIKESEKLPNKIKISLEKSKLLDKEYNDNKLISFINNSLIIENNIKDINYINENIKKCKTTNNIKINFIKENDEEFIKIIDNIKKFGNLIKIGNEFKEINNPWTEERFKYGNYFYYTLKENCYLAEKTQIDNFIHSIKSKYQDKIYKLEFIPFYNKGGYFNIGFADFSQSTSKCQLRESSNAVSLTEIGLYINKLNVNNKIKIENGKKYEFIIDIKNKNFILNIDGINNGKYNFNFQDNIFAQASIYKIGNSIRIKTYEK